MSKTVLVQPVLWLSDKVVNNNYNHLVDSTAMDFYEKFKFKNIEASIGDFVLISNADAAEPDTEEGCDAAQLVALYENYDKKHDRFRAKVQWFSRPGDLPASASDNVVPVSFVNREVIEDHRPFDADVSIETFFRKCKITYAYTDTDVDKLLDKEKNRLHYVCRYRIIPITKRKFTMEPVLADERNRLEMLATPKSAKKRTPSAINTPNSLVKQMSRVSVSESKGWSVSNTDGTRLLLKRAILSDKNEKDSPKKITPRKTYAKKTESQKTPLITPPNKTLNKLELTDILSMELETNSDEELPTLIIRQRPAVKSQKTPEYKTDTPVLEIPITKDSFADSPNRRTGRSRNPVRYMDDYLPKSPTYVTPKKGTMRSVKKRNISERSDDEFVPYSQTPKTRTPRTPKIGTPTRTPKSVVRRINTSQLTPTLHARAHSVDTSKDNKSEIRSLPGREHQMKEILSFVRTKLLEGDSGCMYISGVPGTGKTATVCTSLQILKSDPGLPNFQLVEVNGMKIAEPRQAYVQIYKQLTGKTVAWEQACALLEKRFTNPGPRRSPTVLLVDELDALCTRRQDVLYSIMEWATHNAAQLAVLAVANTMDLPERALAARVASRLGLTRLTFPPYTHAQLQHIVSMRLAHANVTADAVQLIARKVAAVSGDVRRALALCERALELAGEGGAGLREVQQALGEAASGATVRAIRHSSPAEKLLLRAVAAEVERTGSDETTLSRALMTAATIVALDGRGYRSAASVRAPNTEQALNICTCLAASRLLLIETRASDPRIILNISADDVHYATKQIYV